MEFDKAFTGIPYGTLAGLAILIYLCRLLYNAYLNSLAKFPGPRLAGATRWYESYFELVVPPGGQFMFEINRMHEKYGSIVRIGPNEVHVNDPDFRDTLYAQGSRREKVPYMVDLFATPLSVFGTEKHDLHRSRRNVLIRFFSRQTVQKLESLIRAKTGKMCDELSRHHRWQKTVSIRNALTSCIVDITTEYSFGKCANALDGEDFSPQWHQMISGVPEGVPLARQFPKIVQIIQMLPVNIVRMANPLMAAYIDFEQTVRRDVEEIFEQYRNHTLERNKPNFEGVSTIFHEILESSLPEKEKTTDRMTQEAISIIAAASDTTSNVAANIFYFLASNHSYAERVTQELRSVMPEPTTPVEWKRLEELPFLVSLESIEEL
ncbi:hypothetical protein MMC10_003553 [Thelotrema lepadinum]|nr:hypothetical protein [Thelotrema lepadinum]